MIKIADLHKELYKSGEVAEMLGVTTRSVQNYCLHGEMAEIIVNNRRLIPRDSVIAYLDKKGLLNNTAEARQDIVYVRVSTHKQKERGDLQRQVQRVSEFAAFQNPVNLCVIFIIPRL